MDWVLDGTRRNALVFVMRDAAPISVVCALIERDGRMLAARRSARQTMAMQWEFPGGKLQDGESPREALVREIREELRIEIEVGKALEQSRHDYGEFRITLLPFKCTIASGVPTPVEHEALAWCEAGELGALDWAAADVPIVTAYVASTVVKSERR